MRTPAEKKPEADPPVRRATAAQRVEPSLLELQRAAGNRAVSALVAQRYSRAGNPKVAGLRTQVRGRQQALTRHQPAAVEAKAAQNAAKPPQDDRLAQGKVANADAMNAARPGEFDKAAFIRAVNDAIDAQAPTNLDEAEKFGPSGRADAVRGQVQGTVAAGKRASAGAIDTATKAPPDPSKAVDKPVTPLVPDKPPPTPTAPDPSLGAPDRAPADATDFSAGPARVTDQLADAQVTEEQLARSNEPEFTDALAAKKEGEQHAATAPGVVRAHEARTINGAKAAAGRAGAAAMTAMSADRTRAGAALTAGKQGTQSADEAKRAEVTGTLQQVFDATKKDVEDLLTGLDKKVDDAFTQGEKAARDAFTADHKRRMDEYQDRRYSGPMGKARWLRDKFAGLPGEANQIFVVARQGYVARMRQVISTVADLIGAELGRAKTRIAAGRERLQAEVRKLSPDLQALGRQAAGEFSGRFDELTESVDNKGTELVDTLASKYGEALKDVDAEISAEQEKNRGLVARAMDAVGGVVKTILELKDLLLGALAKAASAVLAILKDPIGFLGHLVSALGAGLRNFIANIGEHLKKGLIGWLLGAMAGAGLRLPARFDLRGILGMIGGLLGLTWGAIRGRIVSRGIPEQAMGAVEAGVPVVAKVRSEGVAGLYEEIKEKVGDLKQNLLGKISEYLIPTVLVAGITWIISLLNPASAFIKACKMIIDIVSFILDRGAQIAAFVNSVLDAVIAIAGGGAGGVPALIEKALAASVPVLIGALAAILGIGGIAEKVKKFFQALAKPVMKAVDWVVGKIVGLGKKIWAKLKGAIKGKKGAPDPMDVPTADKAKVAGAAAQAAQQRLTSGSVAPNQAQAVLNDVLGQWRPKGVTSLRLVPVGSHAFAVEAKVNPTVKTGPVAVIVSQQTMLTFNQAMSEPEQGEDPRDVPTWARGLFVYDDTASEYGPARSGEKRGPQKEVGVAEGAHAEEMVVAAFLNVYESLPPDVRYSCRLELDVAASCCLNCAQYVANFVRRLRAAGCQVSAKVHFGRAYQGGQSQRPTVVPDEATEQRAFDALKQNSKLGASASVARQWGRAGDAVPSTGSQQVDRGKEQAKAGFAILRNAGIDVAALGLDRIDPATTGNLTEPQKRVLERRAKQIEKWLAEAEKELVS
ncbi:hypothetical protein [Rhizomonospora bruguierae]|uniref:hypothetical protein n=1 Tax=Rhizomonospora bruguierae TaxID=1581705 RepID=UPI001BD13F4E|nr:hypothetical protein [Micromonospora sp. NBRC 107566]